MMQLNPRACSRRKLGRVFAERGTPTLPGRVTHSDAGYGALCAAGAAAGEPFRQPPSSRALCYFSVNSFANGFSNGFHSSYVDPPCRQSEAITAFLSAFHCGHQHLCSFSLDSSVQCQGRREEGSASLTRPHRGTLFLLFSSFLLKAATRNHDSLQRHGTLHASKLSPSFSLSLHVRIAIQREELSRSNRTQTASPTTLRGSFHAWWLVVVPWSHGPPTAVNRVNLSNFRGNASCSCAGVPLQLCLGIAWQIPRTRSRCCQSTI
jgi:hypothetical protein